MNPAWRKRLMHGLLVTLLYGGIAFALLGPSASDAVVPASNDLGSHLGAVIQAKMAMQDGQFPPRIAPWQHDGWQYPLFQFYSSLPFIFSGLVYQWLTPANPWIAVKITIWLMLTIAGIFTYRLAAYLTGSRPAGLLAGAMYMAAPYFLINIHARGNFAETVAQGILPPVLYYSVRCFAVARLRPFVAAAICWSALAATHIITFVYSSLFIGLWLLLLPGRPRKRLVRLVRTGTAYGCGVLLALYFLAPGLTTDSLVIRDRFYLPYDSNWLTPLATLLSPISLPPEPQPGQLTTPNLHPAVGWPMLFGAAMALYALVARPGIPRRRGAAHVVSALLFVFVLGLFATWSPVDFWSRLPQQLHLIQFPYRLLTQVMWSGALLAAFGIHLLFRGDLDQRHVAVGLLLIGLASSTWLPTQRPNEKKLADIVREPSFYHGRIDYLIRERSPFFTEVRAGGVELPFIEIGAEGNTLKGDRELDLSPLVPYASDPITLHLEGELSPQPVTERVRLSASLDGRTLARTELGAGTFAWDISLRNPLRAEARRTRSRALPLRLVSEWASPREDVPGQPSRDDRPTVRLNSAVIGGLPPEGTALPVSSTESNCIHVGLTTSCWVPVPEQTGLVQLPVLFYPNLLEVQVDGRTVPYVPLANKGYVLVGLAVPPGEHQITARFEGLGWANRISGLVWMGMAMLWLASFIPSSTRRWETLLPVWQGGRPRGTAPTRS